MRLRALFVCAILAILCPFGSVAVAGAHTRHRANHAAAHRKHHKHHRRHRRRKHRKKHHKPAPAPTAVQSTSVLPSMGPLPAPSLFGINTLGYDSSNANFQKGPATALSMGAKWVHFTNDSIHFTNGQPNWATLDYQITQARKLGLGVLISLGGTPNACSISPPPTDFTGCPPTTPADLTAYASYLQQELVRYRNVVQYYESWLEPNGPGFWKGGANPQQYANLLTTQYQVFQQVNSTYHTNLKLLFGGPLSFGTAPSSPGAIAVLPFVDQVLTDLNGAHVFDGIGLHAYRFPTDNNGSATENWGPTALNWDYIDGLSFPWGQSCDNGALWCTMTWPDELRAYEQVFENHGYGQMPLWLTEFGWPGTANPSTALYPSFQTQAQYLSDAYSDILSLPFIEAAFVFNLRDYQPGLPSPDPAFFYNYGLLQYDFQAKPAANVFEQFEQSNPGR